MKSSTLYKLSYALLIAILICGVVFVLYKLGEHKPAPALPSPTASTSPLQTVDTTLGQYNERPNSAPSPSVPAPKTPVVAGCGLTFSFAPNEKVVETGGQVNYILTVHNAGTDTCTNVSFSVYYSDNESFVSASPKPTASDYYWSIGDMASGKTYTVNIVTQEQSVSAPYQIANQACATADNSDDVCPENLIFVGAQSVGATPIAATGAVSSPVPSTSTFTPSGEYGVWEWNSPMQMSAAYESQIVSAMTENGFNAVYVTIEDFEDIAALPDGADKSAKTTAYMQALYNFVTLAHHAGIAVDVEGGEMDWAESANRWKGYALIDFVTAYNKAYPTEEVRALQYDVESYLLPEYNDDQASVLSDFVAFIDASADKMKGTDATLSVVIPHFYDSTQMWTPSFSYKGKDAYTFTHLLDVLQQKPGSTMTILAYRNFFSGDNGTQELVTPEITEASSGGYGTKIVVAQETGDVQPPYVTFHGMTKADLLSALGQITSTFGTYKNFAGVAVHYLDPFLELK